MLVNLKDVTALDFFCLILLSLDKMNVKDVLSVKIFKSTPPGRSGKGPLGASFIRRDRYMRAQLV